MKLVMKVVRLFLIAVLLASCQSDGDDLQRNEVELEKKIAKMNYVSSEYFHNLFVGACWKEIGIYDVYDNNKLGENLLERSEIGGLTAETFLVVNDHIVKHYLDLWSSYGKDYLKVDFGSYSYKEKANQLILNNVSEHLEGELTVFSISQEELILRGKVFSGLWAPDAKFGLYVFKRQSHAETESLEEKWDQGSLNYQHIPNDMFMNCFLVGTTWGNSAVYNYLIETNEITSNIYESTACITCSFKVSESGTLEENVYSDATPDFYSMNEMSFTYDEVGNVLTIRGSKMLPDEDMTFKVMSVSDEELKCLGSPFMPQWFPSLVTDGIYVFKRLKK